MTGQDYKDITIIGGGAAGLYTAFYAGMRDLSVRIIECQDKLGGKVHFYPEKLIWDVGGIPAITGAKLMEQMIEQGMTFDPEVLFNQKIEKLTKDDKEYFNAVSESGQTYKSKAVIIATGGGIFTPKKLPLKNSEQFEKTNLHYNVYKMKHFKGKRIVIVGGGNSAIDWANELSPIAESIHLVHRQNEFRAHESQLRKLQESNVHIHSFSTVKKFVPDASGHRIQAVNVWNSQSNSEFQLPLDECLVTIGFDTEINFHHDRSLGIELVEDYYIKGTSKAATSVKGIYAIGDILQFDGKVRLIAGAYNDAANAVNQIKLSFDPKAQEKAKVSSHNERFKEKNSKKQELLYE